MKKARRKRLSILISCGPTREPIDPVRYISNYSTGTMGALLAAEAIRRGHRVTVVTGPVVVPLPKGARIIAVEQALQMQQALKRRIKWADALIMAAAVSDYRPVSISADKLKRKGTLTLKLKATPDILAGLAARAGQVRVGFALETRQVFKQAAGKLKRKRLDLLLVQDAKQGVFGAQAIRAWLLSARAKAISLGRLSKGQVARVLLDKIEALWYGATGKQRR